LSAHVDFAALAQATGMPTFGPVGQGDFLRRLGIMQRAETLKARADAAERSAIDAALARLIEPGQMGTLFRVLAVGDDRSAAPVGFSDTPSDAT
jgi:NADH dehydrogenase [ubiquinone] 1 alpha subcomplex assembly factor 7